MEGYAFFEMGLGRASFLLAADLFSVPVPSAPPPEPCGPGERRLTHLPVLRLSVLHWELAARRKSSRACFPLLWHLVLGAWEVGGDKSGTCSLTSCPCRAHIVFLLVSEEGSVFSW